MTDKEEYEMMVLELTALAKSWRDAGVKPVDVVVFMLKAATDTAEFAGVDYEVVKGVVDRCYGRDNLLQPKAKA